MMPYLRLRIPLLSAASMNSSMSILLIDALTVTGFIPSSVEMSLTVFGSLETQSMISSMTAFFTRMESPCLGWYMAKRSFSS